jgi:hypothetical protein
MPVSHTREAVDARHAKGHIGVRVAEVHVIIARKARVRTERVCRLRGNATEHVRAVPHMRRYRRWEARMGKTTFGLEPHSVLEWLQGRWGITCAVHAIII